MATNASSAPSVQTSLSPERALEFQLAMRALEDNASTLVGLAGALEGWLRTNANVDEALVLTKESGEGVVQPGELGSRHLSESIRAACRVVLEADEEWERTTWDAYTVIPLRFRGVLIAVTAFRARDDVDPALLAAFEDHAGRSLALAAERERGRDRALELETVYEIDRIRDEHLPFPEMIQRIMTRVLEIIPADGAHLSLVRFRDGELCFERHLRGRHADGRAFAGIARDHTHAFDAIVEASFEEREAIGRPLLVDDDIRDTICVPLLFEDEVLGAFLLVSQSGRKFRGRDRRLFNAVCSQTDTAIFEDLRHQRLKNVFKRYVSRDVFAEMLREETDFLRGRRQDVTCFFSDLRGFTSVSEKLDVDVVVEMLNEHLHTMSEIVFNNGGTVDKFIGDCVMAFFNAPLLREDHALRSIRTAVQMRDAQNSIAAKWKANGLPAVKIGIGMHTGEVFVGNIGGETLVSYTIIGDNVNIASRLEGQSGADDILISGETFALVKDAVEAEPRGELVVRGKTVPIDIFNVTRLKDK